MENQTIAQIEKQVQIAEAQYQKLLALLASLQKGAISSEQEALIQQQFELQGSMLSSLHSLLDAEKTELSPAQTEVLEDLQDIADSTAYLEAGYADVVKEYDDAEKNADEIVAELEEIKTKPDISKSYIQINPDGTYQIKNEPVQNLSISKDLENMHQDYIERYLQVNEAERAQAAKEVQRVLKESPSFEYANYQMKQVKESIRGVKDAVKVVGNAYKEAFSQTAKLATKKIKAKTSEYYNTTLETAKNYMHSATTTYTIAMSKASIALTGAKEFLLEGYRKLARFRDKVLDAMTLGTYSKLSNWTENQRQKTIQNAQNDNLNFSDKIGIKVLSGIQNKKNFERDGASPDEYWKSITDDGFFWGKDVDGEGTYRRSPAQCAVDAASKAKTEIVKATTMAVSQVKAKASQLKTTTKSLVTKVTDKAQDIVKSAKEFGSEVKTDAQKDFALAGLYMKEFAKETEIQIVEATIDHYTRQQARCNAKIKRLEATDKKVHESMEQIKEAMHQLDSQILSPYHKESYKESQELQELRASLPNLSNEQLLETVQLITEMSKTEQEEWEKAQSSKAEEVEAHNQDIIDQYAKLETEYSKLEVISGDLQDRREKCIEKLEKLTEDRQDELTEAKEALQQLREELEDINKKIDQMVQE